MAKAPHSPQFEIDAYRSMESGVTFTGREDPRLTHKMLTEDTRPFAYQRYAEEAHAPIALPSISTAPLDDQYHRCLDMPLRLPGSSVYAVPHEWQGLVPLLKDIINHEHSNNPSWMDYHTYMTVDCRQVRPGEQQRHGGLHVDGFQGERISPKIKITRNYVMTTNGGTDFYPQTFTVVDPTSLNVFQGFDLQAREATQAKENTVYFMNAYTVHESGIANHEGLRTFLRVTYDLKEFDRAGNTHNAMLDYNWDMVARKVHEEVGTPSLDDLRKAPYQAR